MLGRTQTTGKINLPHFNIALLRLDRQKEQDKLDMPPICLAQSMFSKNNLPNPKEFFNCQTENLIHLIIYKTPGCGSQYVGYTSCQEVRLV